MVLWVVAEEFAEIVQPTSPHAHCATSSGHEGYTKVFTQEPVSSDARLEDLKAKWEIDNKPLGKGSYAVVYQCKDIHNGELFAIKVYEKLLPLLGAKPPDAPSPPQSCQNGAKTMLERCRNNARMMPKPFQNHVKTHHNS